MLEMTLEGYRRALVYTVEHMQENRVQLEGVKKRREELLAQWESASEASGEKARLGGWFLALAEEEAMLEADFDDLLSDMLGYRNNDEFAELRELYANEKTKAAEKTDAEIAARRQWEGTHYQDGLWYLVVFDEDREAYVHGDAWDAMFSDNEDK